MRCGPERTILTDQKLRGGAEMLKRLQSVITGVLDGESFSGVCKQYGLNYQEVRRVLAALDFVGLDRPEQRIAASPSRLNYLCDEVLSGYELLIKDVFQWDHEQLANVGVPKSVWSLIDTVCRETMTSKQWTRLSAVYGLYDSPLTYERVGEMEGVSKQAVHMYVKKALSQLQHPTVKSKLMTVLSTGELPLSVTAREQSVPLTRAATLKTVLEAPVASVLTDRRAVNCLDEAQCDTLFDVLTMTTNSMMVLPNCGETTVRKIKRDVANYASNELGFQISYNKLTTIATLVRKKLGTTSLLSADAERVFRAISSF